MSVLRACGNVPIPICSSNLIQIPLDSTECALTLTKLGIMQQIFCSVVSTTQKHSGTSSLRTSLVVQFHLAMCLKTVAQSSNGIGKYSRLNSLTNEYTSIECDRAFS